MRGRIARRRELLRAGDSYRLPEAERIMVWRDANGVTAAVLPPPWFGSR